MAKSKTKNDKSVTSKREKSRKNVKRRPADTNRSSSSSSDKEEYSTSRSTSSSRSDRQRKNKRRDRSYSRSSSSSSRSTSSRRSSRSRSRSAKRSSRGSRSEKKSKKRTTKKERVTVPMKNKRKTASTAKNLSRSQKICSKRHAASTTKQHSCTKSKAPEITRTRKSTCSKIRTVDTAQCQTPISKVASHNENKAPNSTSPAVLKPQQNVSFNGQSSMRSQPPGTPSTGSVLPPRPQVSMTQSPNNRSTAVSPVSRSVSPGRAPSPDLKLPLLIESTHKIRVSPKEKQIYVETKTILKSSATPLVAKDAQPAMLGVKIDHQSLEKEKGRTEEKSDYKVLAGEHKFIFTRTTVIKKSELQENMSHQTKKEHNRLTKCTVDGVSGPLSIHCAQSTVVSGEIYQNKEFISVFLVAEPQLLKQDKLDELLMKRLIQEKLPDATGDRIKMEERMTSSGNHILMLERDVRIVSNNEMWTNENEYVYDEKRSFEYRKDVYGGMSIIETGHTKGKILIAPSPTTPVHLGIPKEDSAPKERAPLNSQQASTKSVDANNTISTSDPNYQILAETSGLGGVFGSWLKTERSGAAKTPEKELVNATQSKKPESSASGSVQDPNYQTLADVAAEVFGGRGGSKCPVVEGTGAKESLNATQSEKPTSAPPDANYQTVANVGSECIGDGGKYVPSKTPEKESMNATQSEKPKSAASDVKKENGTRKIDPDCQTLAGVADGGTFAMWKAKQRLEAERSGTANTPEKEAMKATQSEKPKSTTPGPVDEPNYEKLAGVAGECCSGGYPYLSAGYLKAREEAQKEAEKNQQIIRNPFDDTILASRPNEYADGGVYQKPKTPEKESLNTTQAETPKSPASASKSENGTTMNAPACPNDVSVIHNSTPKRKVERVAPAGLSSEENSSSSKKSDVKNAAEKSKAIQERMKTPKKTESSVVAAISDDVTSFVPAWSRTPRTQSLLSVGPLAVSPAPAVAPMKLDTTPPASPEGNKNDATLTPQKQKISTKKPAQLISFIEKKIDICKYDLTNAEITRTVAVNVECEINGVSHWLMTNYEIKSDAKKIDFVAEKVVCDGKTMWQASEEAAKKSPKTSEEAAPNSPKSKCKITRYASVSAVKKNPSNPVDISK